MHARAVNKSIGVINARPDVMLASREYQPAGFFRPAFSITRALSLIVVPLFRSACEYTTAIVN
jgi:hypothetical protein